MRHNTGKRTKRTMRGGFISFLKNAAGSLVSNVGPHLAGAFDAYQNGDGATLGAHILNARNAALNDPNVRKLGEAGRQLQSQLLPHLDNALAAHRNNDYAGAANHLFNAGNALAGIAQQHGVFNTEAAQKIFSHPLYTSAMSTMNSLRQPPMMGQQRPSMPLQRSMSMMGMSRGLFGRGGKKTNKKRTKRAGRKRY